MDGDAGGGDDGVSINAAVARINEQLSRSVVGGRLLAVRFSGGCVGPRYDL